MKTKQVIDFEKLVGITLSESDGKYYYPSSLDLEGTGVTALPDGLTVGGYLDLRGTGVTALPDGLTVGGSLYLRGTGVTALPDSLTVGGSLDLEGTGVTALPDSLTVGGSLYLRGTGVTDTSKVKRDAPQLLSWRNGRYIKVDGIFSEVVSKKRNVWVLRQIGSKVDTYMVTDGNGKYSHGETLRSAKEDLVYKISNRDKSKYQGMSRGTILSFADAVECYRVITGACGAGVKRFVTECVGKPKKQYSVSEIISLTNGRYGHETFANFFPA